MLQRRRFCRATAATELQLRPPRLRGDLTPRVPSDCRRPVLASASITRARLPPSSRKRRRGSTASAAMGFLMEHHHRTSSDPSGPDHPRRCRSPKPSRPSPTSPAAVPAVRRPEPDVCSVLQKRAATARPPLRLLTDSAVHMGCNCGSASSAQGPACPFVAYPSSSPPNWAWPMVRNPQRPCPVSACSSNSARYVFFGSCEFANYPELTELQKNPHTSCI